MNVKLHATDPRCGGNSVLLCKPTKQRFLLPRCCMIQRDNGARRGLFLCDSQKRTKQRRRAKRGQHDLAHLIAPRCDSIGASQLWGRRRQIGKVPASAASPPRSPCAFCARLPNASAIATCRAANS
jgi:hypothetical protein